MTIALLASCASFSSATGCTTSNVVVTGGTILIASTSICRGGSGCQTDASLITGITVTDSNGGNTWEKPSSSFISPTGSGNIAIQGEVACSVVGGTYDFTTTGASGSDSLWGPILFIYAVSGGSTASGTGCYDSAVTAVQANTAGTTQGVVSGTVGQSGELIFGGIRSTLTETPSQTPITGSFPFDQSTIGPSSGTQTMSWTTSGTAVWSGVAIGILHP